MCFCYDDYTNDMSWIIHILRDILDIIYAFMKQMVLNCNKFIFCKLKEQYIKIKDINAYSGINFVAWALRKGLIKDDSRINEDFKDICWYT